MIAPPALDSSKAIIRITITIHTILQVNKVKLNTIKIILFLQIDEIGETFYVSFNQDAAWIDPRLVYKNLKRNTDLNVLSEGETDAIWTPQIVFYNTKGKEESVADERTILSVIPGEEFKFERTDQTTFENIYMFQGSENNLKLSKTHDTKFLCSYDMAWYPFDTQICTMDIVLNIVQVFYNPFSMRELFVGKRSYVAQAPFCSVEAEQLSYMGPTELVSNSSTSSTISSSSIIITPIFFNT